MPTREEIHHMAHLLRAAHCTLDRIATDHLQKGERETVGAFCQTIRNCYQEVFEELKGEVHTSIGHGSGFN